MKNVNSLSENEFILIFGSVFEKSEWIAIETFKQAPFENTQDLIKKMVSNFNNCSDKEIFKILNLHPKLAIEKKLTNLSSKEQIGAKLDTCSKEELEEFENLNIKYQEKFKFPFIIAIKGKDKNEILSNFRKRIKNDYETEFKEAKIQVQKIASFRLNDILRQASY